MSRTKILLERLTGNGRRGGTGSSGGVTLNDVLDATQRSGPVSAFATASHSSSAFEIHAFVQVRMEEKV